MYKSKRAALVALRQELDRRGYYTCVVESAVRVDSIKVKVRHEGEGYLTVFVKKEGFAIYDDTDYFLDQFDNIETVVTEAGKYLRD